MPKGKCKHGEFELMDGCPQCVADRMASEKEGPNLIKVQYYSSTTGELSSREYTYFSEERVAIGDILTVPVRDTTGKAKVSAIDIPDSEISAFRDKVKTIPNGSVLGHAEDGEENEVTVADVTFEQMEQEMEESMDAMEREIDAAADAECAEAESRSIATAIALRPGEDIEVRSYYEEAQRLLEYANARKIDGAIAMKDASDDLVLISGLTKKMDAKKKEYLDPLKAQSDAIRETYNLLMAPVLQAGKITKEKMLAYSLLQETIRKAQEEINRKRIEAAQEEMKLTGELSESVNIVEVTPEPSKTTRTDMGSSSTVDHWTYEIIDIDALPRAYMMPDTVMLNATAKKYHDTKPVPGVVFKNVPIISTRAK